MLDDDGGVRDVRGRPALDAQGGPLAIDPGQEAVAVDESLFGSIQAALQRFEIFNPRPDVRRAAVLKLSNSRDPAAAAVLARVLERGGPSDPRAAEEGGCWLSGRAGGEARHPASLIAPEAALAQPAPRRRGPICRVRGRARGAASLVVHQHPWLSGNFNGVRRGAAPMSLAGHHLPMGVINMAHGEMSDRPTPRT
jgi:hypothetical protein